MLHSWPEYVDLTRAVGRLGANPSRSIACACSLNGYDFWFEFLSVNARNCIPIGKCGVLFAVSATIRLDHTVKSRCAIGCTREVLKPPGKGTNDERRSAVCVSPPHTSRTWWEYNRRLISRLLPRRCFADFRS